MNKTDYHRDIPEDRAEMAHAALPLVYSLAASLHARLDQTLEFDELVSLGTIGLMQAAERWDADGGATFATFAYYRINGAMIDGLRKMGSMSRRAWRRYKQRRAARSLHPEQDAPSDESTPMYARQAVHRTVLNSMVTHPNVENDIALQEAGALIGEAMTQLPARECKLLRSCYYEDRTLTDAGRSLGLSKSGTSRMHNRALERIRNHLAGHALEQLAA